MKKLIIFLIVVGLVAGAVYFFRDSITEVITSGKNKAIDLSIDKMAEKYSIPKRQKEDIKEIAKTVDVETIIDFAKDPEEFMKGNTEKSKDFMNSPSGRKLKNIMKNYVK